MAKILITLIMFLIFGIFATGAVKEKKYLQSIEDELKKNEPEVKALEELSSYINTLKIHRDFLIDVKREDIALEVLRELTNLLPADTWITNLDYKEISSKGEKNSEAEIVISGFSSSSSGLISLLEDSPLFEQVVFVGPVRKVMDKEDFRIKAYLVMPEKPLEDKRPAVAEEGVKDETSN